MKIILDIKKLHQIYEHLLDPLSLKLFFNLSIQQASMLMTARPNRIKLTI